MKKMHLMDRFMSLCYDLIFILILTGLIILSVGLLKIPNLQKIIIISVLVLVVYILVNALLPLKLNGTLGKYLNDLAVEPTKGKITFGRMLFREIVFKHLLYLTIIGILVEIGFFITKRETIHDYYLKTKVVKRQVIEIKKEKKFKIFGKNK